MPVNEREQGKMPAVRTGGVIEIRARKADGTCYRWWHAVVESSDAEGVVTLNRAGDRVNGPAGGWAMKHASRTTYWFSRPYNLAEVYQPDGSLKQIYIHIASPAELRDGTLIYVDHELDVVKRPGEELRIVDEDEFDQAAAQFGYSHEFKCSCRDAVDEAIDLASRWCIAGAPKLRSRRSRLR